MTGPTLALIYMEMLLFPLQWRILAAFSMQSHEFEKLRFYPQILMKLFSADVSGGNKSDPYILIFGSVCFISKSPACTISYCPLIFLKALTW